MSAHFPTSQRDVYFIEICPELELYCTEIEENFTNKESCVLCKFVYALVHFTDDNCEKIIGTVQDISLSEESLLKLQLRLYKSDTLSRGSGKQSRLNKLEAIPGI